MKIKAVDTAEDLQAIAQACHAVKEDTYWQQCLSRQKIGSLTIFVAYDEGIAVSYVILNRQPRYGLYQRLNIPEIQDLNTIPERRREGIATQLIAHCENIARQEGYEDIGISVGLHAGYGAAQRLYVRLGYMPDGQGITYDRESIKPHASYAVDDDLCLMMTKAL